MQCDLCRSITDLLRLGSVMLILSCDVDFDVDSNIRFFTDAEQHPQAWSGVGGWTRWEWDRWNADNYTQAWNALQTSDVPPAEEEHQIYIYI